jgi:hypothetical protein
MSKIKKYAQIAEKRTARRHFGLRRIPRSICANQFSIFIISLWQRGNTPFQILLQVAKAYFSEKISNGIREESATGTSSRLADLRVKVKLLKELGDEELDESRINQMKRARLALFDELMNTEDESRSRCSN